MSDGHSLPENSPQEEPFEPVETYRYIDDDELQKDFMSGIELSTTNIPKKVYFYIYSIDNAGGEAADERPFLKVYLSVDATSGKAVFPSVDINSTDVLGGGNASDLNQMFLDACMEKFTTEILKDHEIATNYREHYKGFIFHNEKVIIVFETLLTPEGLFPALIDEIINKKMINNTAVDESLPKFFYDNQNCLYITTENFENLEIPQVFYGEDSLVRTAGDYGFFYKLSSAPSETAATKYVGFVEDRVFYESATSTQSPSAADINREFDASVIVDPTVNFWYFKCAQFFRKN